MKLYKTENTPIGALSVAEENGLITDIVFGRTVTGAENGSTPLIDTAFSQLYEYFDGKRKAFDLPLYIGGTPFQNSVWLQLCTIPYGETITYKQLAEKINNPKACRAVGMANNKNKLPIVIPCHRVIGANGTLTGYAGGLDIKKFLIDIEANNR